MDSPGNLGPLVLKKKILPQFFQILEPFRISKNFFYEKSIFDFVILHVGILKNIIYHYTRDCDLRANCFHIFKIQMYVKIYTGCKKINVTK